MRRVRLGLAVAGALAAGAAAAAEDWTTNRARPACLGQDGELTALINGPHGKRQRSIVTEVIRQTRSDDLNIYGAPGAAFKIEFFTRDWAIRPASGSSCELQWLLSGEPEQYSAYAYIDAGLGDGALRSCLARSLAHALCLDDGAAPPAVAY